MRNSRKAQSIMEYIIILTALISVFLIVRSRISNSVNKSYGHLSDEMTEAVTSIDSGVSKDK